MKIKEFTEEFFTDDTGEAMRSSVEWELMLINKMKDSGYVRVLDIDIIRTVEYMPDKEIFKMIYSAQGVFKGKKKAWKLYGVAGGREIPVD